MIVTFSPSLILTIILTLIGICGFSLYKMLVSRKDNMWGKRTEVVDWRKDKKNQGIEWRDEKRNKSLSSFRKLPSEKIGEKRMVLFFTGTIMMLFMMFLFIPYYGIYATLTKTNTLYTFFIIYTPIGISMLLIISAIKVEPIYTFTCIRMTAFCLFFLMLIDLWFPKIVISGEGEILLIEGYRISLDYILLSFYKMFIPLRLLESKFLNLSICWYLIYFIGTITLSCFMLLTISVRNLFLRSEEFEEVEIL